MSPSFFSLFKRGRYFRAPSDADNSAEAKAQREERERFAVAALAFCLKHDQEFLKHFWQRICRFEKEDPAEMPPLDPGAIQIEPPRWADLRIFHNGETGRYMWVVEVKAGAPLEEIQNPDLPKFQEEGVGYGWLFAKDQKHHGTRMRYIILGAAKNIDTGRRPFGILLQQHEWKVLTDKYQPSKIVADLFYTLGELQVGAFYMEQAKQISIEGGIENVGKAWKVLNAISKEYLKLRPSDSYFEPDELVDGGGSMGLYIKPPTNKHSEEHTLLQNATRKDGWSLAWFGYECKKDAKAYKSVWLYVDNVERQDLLTQKLKRQFDSATPERDSSDYWVVVSSQPKESQLDFEWFRSVFECAIRM